MITDDQSWWLANQLTAIGPHPSDPIWIRHPLVDQRHQLTNRESYRLHESIRGVVHGGNPPVIVIYTGETTNPRLGVSQGYTMAMAPFVILKDVFPRDNGKILSIKLDERLGHQWLLRLRWVSDRSAGCFSVAYSPLPLLGIIQNRLLHHFWVVVVISHRWCCRCFFSLLLLLLVVVWRALLPVLPGSRLNVLCVYQIWLELTIVCWYLDYHSLLILVI